ncbi:MAG: acyltransferase [Desulfobacterota bacterium]|nr:acyltransferase [Thermodesulfobacteriota bacterium]
MAHGFFRWWRKRLKRELRRLRELHELEQRFPTARIEEEVQIVNPKNLRLGNHVYICKGSVLHCGGEPWCDFRGGITIGDHVYIAPNCVLFGAGEIEIGNRCQFGPGVMLIAQSLDMRKIMDETTLDRPSPPHVFGKIVLEDGVMIGAGSMVLMGVRIGRGAYIAAGCIVKNDVAPYSFVIPRDRYKIINRNSPLVIKK